MSEQKTDDGLQFTHAQPVAGAAGAGPAACSACNQPIAETYYAAGQAVVCPPCRDGLVAALGSGSGAARFLRATVFGIGAGIAGAAVWYGVRRVTNMEIGLIAIVVGAMVGAAVRAGANRRGGIGYQLMAVALTYLTIGASFVPEIISELRTSPEFAEAGATAIAVVTAIAAIVGPVLVAKSSIIMVLIYGFALWEAWQMNRRMQLDFEGPYSIAGRPAPGALQA